MQTEVTSLKKAESVQDNYRGISCTTEKELFLFHKYKTLYYISGNKLYKIQKYTEGCIYSLQVVCIYFYMYFWVNEIIANGAAQTVMVKVNLNYWQYEKNLLP